MKRVLLVITSAMMLAPLCVALANDPQSPAPPPRDMQGRGHQEADQAVERWMQVLASENPAEFERLQQLRTDDPRAFRRELHQRLRSMRMMHSLQQCPRLHELIAPLPEEERSAVIDELISIPSGSGRERRRGGAEGDRMGAGPDGHMPPPGPPANAEHEAEMERLQTESMALVKTYHAATDDKEKTETLEKLRQVLSQIFDLRESERQAQITQIEQELTRLRKTLKTRGKNRERIIDRHLNDLTSEDSMRW